MSLSVINENESDQALYENAPEGVSCKGASTVGEEVVLYANVAQPDGPISDPSGGKPNGLEWAVNVPHKIFSGVEYAVADMKSKKGNKSKQLMDNVKYSHNNTKSTNRLKKEKIKGMDLGNTYLLGD